MIHGIDLSFVPEGERTKLEAALPRLLEEQTAFEKALEGLLPDVGPLAAGVKDVEVVPQWWGLVFVLSDKAVRDLAAGESGVAAVAGLIAAACSLIPGINVATALIAAVLTLHATIIGAVNRGNGVYITALWTTIHLPALWIPTPR